MAKGKWHKMYSETLAQEIAFDENSGWLFCADGCRYSPKEVAVITDSYTSRAAFPLAVHIVKSAFKGEVVRRGAGGERKAKTQTVATVAATQKTATATQTQTVATVATEKQYEFDIY